MRQPSYEVESLGPVIREIEKRQKELERFGRWWRRANAGV